MKATRATRAPATKAKAKAKTQAMKASATKAAKATKAKKVITKAGETPATKFIKAIQAKKEADDVLRRAMKEAKGEAADLTRAMTEAKKEAADLTLAMTEAKRRTADSSRAGSASQPLPDAASLPAPSPREAMMEAIMAHFMALDPEKASDLEPLRRRLRAQGHAPDVVDFAVELVEATAGAQQLSPEATSPEAQRKAVLEAVEVHFRSLGPASASKPARLRRRLCTEGHDALVVDAALEGSPEVVREATSLYNQRKHVLTAITSLIRAHPEYAGQPERLRSDLRERGHDADVVDFCLHEHTDVVHSCAL